MGQAKTKRVVKYMHTLDGKPAHYQPGQQVVFASRGVVKRLCGSLRDIRSQQKRSEQWRARCGYPPSACTYGHVRVYVD